MNRWYSQLGQDAWAFRLGRRDEKPYFVEIGAGDGVHLSNSLALEERGWSGLCIEAGPAFQALLSNRRCMLDDSCLYDREGVEIAFRVDAEDGHFNGIAPDLGRHREREGVTIAKVSSTIGRVLEKCDAPRHITFLSIDTEGSELRILSALPFETYTIGAVCVEHNWEEPKRSELRALLEAHGFVRVAERSFDDWYLNTAVHGRVRITAERAAESIRTFRAGVRRVLEGVRSRVRAFALGRVPSLTGHAELESVLRKVRPKRVLHVGANDGAEAPTYERCGVEQIVWVEALPDVAREARSKLREPRHRVLEGLLLDVGGERRTFYLANNRRMSSSVFASGPAMTTLFPELQLRETVELVSVTGDELLARHGLAEVAWDLVVLDVQGAELLCVKGMAQTLARATAVLTEYSTEGVYEGGVQLGELTAQLMQRGFRREPMWRRRPHGDVLFLRRRIR